jgi:hypothetical protein
MAVYGVRQLTQSQRALSERVCAGARTLHDRLRELGQIAWDGVNPTDVDAVRAWTSSSFVNAPTLHHERAGAPAPVW